MRGVAGLGGEGFDALLDPVQVRRHAGERRRPRHLAAKADAEGGDADERWLAVSLVDDERAARVTLWPRRAELAGNKASDLTQVEPLLLSRS